MSTDPVRRANLAAIACDPRPQLPEGFRRNSTRLGAALGAARTGLSVYELPPGQAVSPYHYENPTRSGSSSSQARQPCGIRAAKSNSNRGTSSSFPSGPAGAHLVRNNSESTPASRCSPRRQRRSVPSSTRTVTWSGSGQRTTRSTWSSSEAVPRTTSRRGLLKKARPTPRRKHLAGHNSGMCAGKPDPRSELVGRGYDAIGGRFAVWRDRIVGDPRRAWEEELVSRLPGRGARARAWLRRRCA